MKKLIATLLLVFVQVAVFANPTDTNSNNNKKKKKSAFTETVEEKIVIKTIQPISQPSDKVTVVVVNAQGDTISKQDVNVRDFFSASASSIVPKGSSFLMFFEGTAFYVTNN